MAEQLQIPLPEHPRPDAHRAHWQNLNGSWQFRFDPEDEGEAVGWQQAGVVFPLTITVPFPWGAPLSGLTDEAAIGWYRRQITPDPEWDGRRIFVVIGACDHRTTVWLDGKEVGRHVGGYVPFACELTDLVQPGGVHELVIRADDRHSPEQLQGKQHYGDARGIWQTVYLEARGERYVDLVQWTSAATADELTARVRLDAVVAEPTTVQLRIDGGDQQWTATATVASGQREGEAVVAVPGAQRWAPDTPQLYETEVQVGDDVLAGYTALRTIGVVDLPESGHRYVAINGKPVYLQLALDQSYHPEGYYTFPSDAFIREELERTLAIGLNGIRPHIKVEVPRKLYWADRLGLLVMADLPHAKGPPDAAAQRMYQDTLRAMIERDYNHPAIFSWINFNETWGLRRGISKAGWVEEGKGEVMVYEPAAQQFAASMYYFTRSLDPTRLVDDNSIHSYWLAMHTVTDLVSSHDYLPGYLWEDRLRQRCDWSTPGSSWQFAPGFVQGDGPLINAECGNVWGYEGTTGDVDWSWDYHRMVNAFRKYPKMSGWVYTELHDVPHEWNGYWRYDRSAKDTGLADLVPGMSLRDFHAPVFLSTGGDIFLHGTGGEVVSIPLWLSSMTDVDHGDQLRIRWAVQLLDAAGRQHQLATGERPVAYRPYLQAELEPLAVELPMLPGLATVQLWLLDPVGDILHRNVAFIRVAAPWPAAAPKLIALAADAFSDADFSLRQWTVRDGAKFNGAGSGQVTYDFTLPEELQPDAEVTIRLIVECGAKQLFIKDMTDEQKAAWGLELHYRTYPDSNPNAYPMTDELLTPSRVAVVINDAAVGEFSLPDDPADHRGVLSWGNQPEPDGVDPEPAVKLNNNLHHLVEPGSYGYPIEVVVPADCWQQALAGNRQLRVRLQTVGDGGLAVYGPDFGRLPYGPSLVIESG